MVQWLASLNLVNVALTARTSVHMQGTQSNLESVDATCASYKDLKCGKSVGYAFHQGRHQKWAKTAYSNMQAVSGVSYKQATGDDYHRLQFCGGVDKAKRCELPPCKCTTPPCNTCGSFVAPKEKVYQKHSGKGCFLHHGATPLVDDFDEELPGWPSDEECQQACDDSFKCKAFTRGTGTSSTCYLRTSVNLGKCKNDGEYETHVREVDPDEKETKCANYTSLNCGETVAWAFNSGKKQSWASKAYGEMQSVSGVPHTKATVQDFHRLQFCGAIEKSKKCELPPCTCSNPPCGSCGKFVPPPAPPPKGPSEVKLHAAKHGKLMGYHMTNRWVGQNWCKAQPPAPEFSLNKACPADRSLEVRVLTYNLFWWHLFGVRNGANRMAGKLVIKEGPWDLMGFQECDNLTRVIDDSSALQTHGMYNGTAAVSNAWDQGKWKVLETGYKLVSEDDKSQWYGKRAVVWTRVQHKQTNKVVFFMNYHGSLPVGGPRDGGACGGEATAYNMLRVMGEHAHEGDNVILVGDFNAIKNSILLKTLAKYMNHQYQGKSFGGVDNVFTNSCPHLVSKKNLGNGGSDHDALGVVFRI